MGDWLARARRRPWRFLLFLAGLCLLVSAGGWLGVNLWHEHHFRAAETAIEQWDLDRAQSHLERCLKVRPRNVSVLLLAARTARRRDALDEADRQLAACESVQGVTAGSALERLLLRAQQGDLLDTEDTLQVLLNQDSPDKELIREALAQGYLNAFRPHDAMDCLNRLIGEQPRHFRALLLRGQLWETLGRGLDALADYQQAVDVVPRSTEARLRLAQVLAHQGRTLDAVAYYERLRRREPNRPEVLLGLARCREDLAELDEAGKLLDRVLAVQPDFVAALIERGRVALHNGQPEAGAVWLQRAITTAPFDRDAHWLLHLCLDAQGKERDDRACLDRLQQIEMATAHIATLMSRILEEPHNPTLRLEIGQTLMRCGHPEEGFRWLLSAWQIDPQHAPTRAALDEYFQRSEQKGR
jgi:tetratricopeptide (TPR) repeat protein